MLAAAVVEGDGFSSLKAARDGIRALWGMDVEIDELRDVVASLETEGMAQRVKGGFSLTDQARDDLQKAAEENEAVERQAFTEWERTVRAGVPQMTDEEFSVLIEDLRVWLGQVIARHGVESALILYPENPRAQELFDAIEKLGLRFLPDRTGCIKEVRDWAFQMFVRSPSPAQRTYLASLLNTAFYMTVLTLDPEASALVQERIAGHRVYLDTNFLYALLGLGGTATETLSAARILELTKDMGYEVVVTRWTVDELKTSLRAAERRISRLPMPRQDLAELMTLKSGESDITKAYWMRYKNTGIRPKDFFEFYAHVESVLEQHGIKVNNEGRVAVDQNRAAVDQQLVLLDRFIGDRDKDDLVKEHDVKHRLLVERLRGDGNLTFSNARFWFLTRDSKLPRYAMATLDGHKVELPFCVGTSAWVQVMRAFTPRTEDFDKSLVELLSTPYLRYRGGPGVSPRVVDAVVGRVDAYKGATPKLAAEVLADTALTESIASAKDEAEQDAQVENAFVVKSEELRERAEASERRETQQREQRQAAEEVARRRAAEADDLHKRLTALERDAEEQRKVQERQAEEREREELAGLEANEAERQAAAETAEREREQHEAELRTAAETERQRRERAERRLVMGGAAGLLLAAAVVCALAFVLHAGTALLVGMLSVGALLLCGAVRVGLGSERGWKVLTFIFGFSGIVGLITAAVIAATAK